jgi:peptidoglycan/LPS O-acetylase OafA/YrhL
VLAGLFASMLLVALGTPDGMPARTFQRPGMRFFGRYSYALYVFHLPVAFFLDRFLFRVADTAPVLGSRTPALLLFVLVATGASVCVALLSWHALEKHFLALKHRFTGRALPVHRGAVSLSVEVRVRERGLRRVQDQPADPLIAP